MTSFGERLVEANQPVWAVMAAHPFVLALAGGTLPEALLRAWLQQDRLFVLEERCAVAALRAHVDTWTAVAARSPAGSPYRGWIDNWSGEGFRGFVAELGGQLDGLAGSPSPAGAGRLGAVFGRAARRAALSALGRDLRRPGLRRAGRLVRRPAGPGGRGPAAGAAGRLRAR